MVATTTTAMRRPSTSAMVIPGGPGAGPGQRGRSLPGAEDRQVGPLQPPEKPGQLGAWVHGPGRRQRVARGEARRRALAHLGEVAGHEGIGPVVEGGTTAEVHKVDLDLQPPSARKPVKAPLASRGDPGDVGPRVGGPVRPGLEQPGRGRPDVGAYDRCGASTARLLEAWSDV